MDKLLQKKEGLCDATTTGADGCTYDDLLRSRWYLPTIMDGIRLAAEQRAAATCEGPAQDAADMQRRLTAPKIPWDDVPPMSDARREAILAGPRPPGGWCNPAKVYVPRPTLALVKGRKA